MSAPHKSECPLAGGHVAKEITVTGQHSTPTTHEAEPLTLTACKTEARMDTRLLAKHLGNKHKAVFQLLTKHKADFLRLGKVPFEMEALPSGQREKYGALNEDQSFLMLTFSSNTTKVRDLKVKMVRAFGEARKARELHQTEYLPAYRALHDGIHALASGSDNERRVHVNFNRLVNRAAGIESGQRGTASLPTQSLIVVAQLMIAQAMQSAHDHHDGYQLAKAALKPLLALTAGNVLQLEVAQ